MQRLLAQPLQSHSCCRVYGLWFNVSGMRQEHGGPPPESNRKFRRAVKAAVREAGVSDYGSGFEVHSGF